MANQKASDETQATGHFNATHNGSDLFKSERVVVWYEGNLLVIEGSVNLGFPGGRAFNLSINPFTQSGPSPFVPGGDLSRVFYLDEKGTTVFAQSGTFDANLNNSTKRYRISFALNFPRFGEIQGDIDVTE